MISASELVCICDKSVEVGHKHSQVDSSFMPAGHTKANDK